LNGSQREGRNLAMPVKKEIKTDDFLKMFNCTKEELPEQFFTIMKNTNTTYKEADLQDYKEFFYNTITYINSLDARTEEENYSAFEKGWNENLELFNSDTTSLEHLRPKYVQPGKFLRFNRELIVAENPYLEYDLFTLARYILFSKYLSSYDDIYEFGCGSCQNLHMLSQMYPSTRLYGTDWSESSVKIAEKLGTSQHLNTKGYLFDMLHPPSDFTLQPNSAVFTIHTLEQLGTGFDKFLSFLLKSKPGIVLHYEPIREFYDPDHLLDYLAILHDSKRNYLSGYATALQKLEEQKKIEIIESRRTYLGGPLHESTSVLVWKPVE